MVTLGSLRVATGRLTIQSWVRVLLAVPIFMLLGAVPRAHASLTVELSVPETLPSDGVTEVRIPIRVPEGRKLAFKQVRAKVNAGRVQVVSTKQGHPELAYVPPHLKERKTVTLEVTVSGPPAYTGTARIKLTPPKRTLSYRRTPGEFSLEVPEEFVLGEDQSANVFIRGFASQPMLSINAGSLSSPRRKGPDTWQATFRPPEAAFPQRALLVASTRRGDHVVFTHFDLIGRPSVETQTEPMTLVEVTVGSRTFGPLQSDARGRARFTVLAPPGMSDAQVTATDRFGNSRTTKLALGAPDFSRLHLVCPEFSGRVLVFGTEIDGKPLAQLPSLRSTLGRISAHEEVAAGFFEAQLEVDEALSPDTPVTIEARVPGSALRPSCVTTPPGESPTALLLRLSTTNYLAGDGPVLLEVSLVYPGDERPRPVNLKISTDHGEVTEEEPIDDNRFSALWLPPNSLEQVNRITITAQVERLPEVATTATLEVLGFSAPGSKGDWASRLVGRGGYMTNFGQVSAPFFGLAVSRDLASIATGFAAGIEAGYFSSQHETQAVDSSESIRVKAQGLPLSSRFTLSRRFDKLEAYAGAGAGLVVATTNVKSESTGEASELSAVWLARGLAGAAYELPVGMAGVEGGYIYCPIHQRAASGNLCGVDVTATYHYPF